MAQQFTYIAMQMQLEEVLYKQKKREYFLNPLPVCVLQHESSSGTLVK